jgi:hypothetical protein
MNAEEIRARRKAVKQEYGRLYDRVAAILFEEDPVGINFEDNTDEYEPETDTILPRLKFCRSAEEVRSVVHEEFVRWFDGHVAGPQDRYGRIAKRIWTEISALVPVQNRITARCSRRRLRAAAERVIVGQTGSDMAARGVHFALTDAEVRELESRDDDEARLEYVQEEIEEKFFESRQSDLAETDKAWDAIHRCLTDGTLKGASTSPLEVVVLGGKSLYSGDDYIMTLKRVDEVRAVVPHLARITEASLRGSYEKLDANEYDGEIGDDDFGYTWENFVALRDFWERAAANGRSVLFTVDQ